jgi:hypothetical protein
MAQAFRSSSAASTTLLLTLCVVASLPFAAHAHGYVTVPKSRNFVAYQAGLMYDPGNGNGIGPSASLPRGNPGVCGDPFQLVSPASDYVSNPTPIQATYTAGQAISITVKVTANHGGYFAFR